ncbi:glutaredoxin family protein [Janthinobacterium sp. 17J80-10]|uniref:glutaredoxin family protein n=1 Tax=Janthinobacterium sp. 17J80-10 TaxID=2497863 RepID=UPI0010059913|nr:glutaredoxin family protein [Janthinobacterium sp. 17J80-10]QAU34253.1 glutaredoxin family protein [Janthinobacterium sp. 17J80-10]
MAVEFTLYSRSYCHLCDDMLAALQALQGEFSFTVSVEDVDADPALVELYDELVPVLVGRHAGTESRLCHYFLDAEAVRAFLHTALSS